MLLAGVVFTSLLMYGQAAAQPAEDLNTLFTNLKAAEQAKDYSKILKLATESSRMARETIAKPMPTDKVDADTHKYQVEFAKQVETYSDYALFAAGLRAPDNAQKMEFYEALEKQSPNSQYIPQLNGTYVTALSQSSKKAQVFPFAEKAIAKDPNNEELLMILADGCMSRKQWDRAATYGAKLASVMNGHAKPEGMAAADWDKRRAALEGRGYWIAGMSYATSSKWPQADKNLRAALPLIKGEMTMYTGALFQLGVANYQLARATQNKSLLSQAIEFSTQCATFQSSYQDQASKNVWAMKQELRNWR
jgi:uncharacterized protein HemY